MSKLATRESDKVAWVRLADVPALIAQGDITSGTTLAAALRNRGRPLGLYVAAACRGRPAAGRLLDVARRRS